MRPAMNKDTWFCCSTRTLHQTLLVVVAVAALLRVEALDPSCSTLGYDGTVQFNTTGSYVLQCSNNSMAPLPRLVINLTAIRIGCTTEWCNVTVDVLSPVREVAVLLPYSIVPPPLSNSTSATTLSVVIVLSNPLNITGRGQSTVSDANVSFSSFVTVLGRPRDSLPSFDHVALSVVVNASVRCAGLSARELFLDALTTTLAEWGSTLPPPGSMSISIAISALGTLQVDSCDTVIAVPAPTAVAGMAGWMRELSFSSLPFSSIVVTNVKRLILMYGGQVDATTSNTATKCSTMFDLQRVALTMRGVNVSLPTALVANDYEGSFYAALRILQLASNVSSVMVPPDGSVKGCIDIALGNGCVVMLENAALILHLATNRTPVVTGTNGTTSGGVFRLQRLTLSILESALTLNTSLSGGSFAFYETPPSFDFLVSVQVWRTDMAASVSDVTASLSSTVCTVSSVCSPLTLIGAAVFTTQSAHAAIVSSVSVSLSNRSVISFSSLFEMTMISAHHKGLGGSGVLLDIFMSISESDVRDPFFAGTGVCMRCAVSSGSAQLINATLLLTMATVEFNFSAGSMLFISGGTHFVSNVTIGIHNNTRIRWDGEQGSSLLRVTPSSSGPGDSTISNVTVVVALSSELWWKNVGGSLVKVETPQTGGDVNLTGVEILVLNRTALTFAEPDTAALLRVTAAGAILIASTMVSLSDSRLQFVGTGSGHLMRLQGSGVTATNVQLLLRRSNISASGNISIWHQSSSAGNLGPLMNEYQGDNMIFAVQCRFSLPVGGASLLESASLGLTETMIGSIALHVVASELSVGISVPLANFSCEGGSVSVHRLDVWLQEATMLLNVANSGHGLIPFAWMISVTSQNGSVVVPARFDRAITLVVLRSLLNHYCGLVEIASMNAGPIIIGPNSSSNTVVVLEVTDSIASFGEGTGVGGPMLSVQCLVGGASMYGLAVTVRNSSVAWAVGAAIVKVVAGMNVTLESCIVVIVASSLTSAALTQRYSAGLVHVRSTNGGEASLRNGTVCILANSTVRFTNLTLFSLVWVITTATHHASIVANNNLTIDSSAIYVEAQDAMLVTVHSTALSSASRLSHMTLGLRFSEVTMKSNHSFLVLVTAAASAMAANVEGRLEMCNVTMISAFAACLMVNGDNASLASNASAILANSSLDVIGCAVTMSVGSGALVKISSRGETLCDVSNITLQLDRSNASMAEGALCHIAAGDGMAHTRGVTVTATQCTLRSSADWELLFVTSHQSNEVSLIQTLLHHCVVDVAGVYGALVRMRSEGGNVTARSVASFVSYTALRFYCTNLSSIHYFQSAGGNAIVTVTNISVVESGIGFSASGYLLLVAAPAASAELSNAFVSIARSDLSWQECPNCLYASVLDVSAGTTTHATECKVIINNTNIVSGAQYTSLLWMDGALLTANADNVIVDVSNQCYISFAYTTYLIHVKLADRSLGQVSLARSSFAMDSVTLLHVYKLPQFSAVVLLYAPLGTVAMEQCTWQASSSYFNFSFPSQVLRLHGFSVVASNLSVVLFSCTTVEVTSFITLIAAGSTVHAECLTVDMSYTLYEAVDNVARLDWILAFANINASLRSFAVSCTHSSLSWIATSASFVTLSSDHGALVLDGVNRVDVQSTKMVAAGNSFTCVLITGSRLGNCNSLRIKLNSTTIVNQQPLFRLVSVSVPNCSLSNVVLLMTDSILSLGDESVGMLIVLSDAGQNTLVDNISIEMSGVNVTGGKSFYMITAIGEGSVVDVWHIRIVSHRTILTPGAFLGMYVFGARLTAQFIDFIAASSVFSGLVFAVLQGDLVRLEATGRCSAVNITVAVENSKVVLTSQDTVDFVAIQANESVVRNVTVTIKSTHVLIGASRVPATLFSALATRSCDARNIFIFIAEADDIFMLTGRYMSIQSKEGSAQCHNSRVEIYSSPLRWSSGTSNQVFFVRGNTTAVVSHVSVVIQKADISTSVTSFVAFVTLQCTNGDLSVDNMSLEVSRVNASVAQSHFFGCFGRTSVRITQSTIHVEIVNMSFTSFGVALYVDSELSLISVDHVDITVGNSSLLWTCDAACQTASADVYLGTPGDNGVLVIRAYPDTFLASLSVSVIDSNLTARSHNLALVSVATGGSLTVADVNVVITRTSYDAVMFQKSSVIWLAAIGDNSASASNISLLLSNSSFRAGLLGSTSYVSALLEVQANGVVSASGISVVVGRSSSVEWSRTESAVVFLSGATFNVVSDTAVVVANSTMTATKVGHVQVVYVGSSMAASFVQNVTVIVASSIVVAYTLFGAAIVEIVSNDTFASTSIEFPIQSQLHGIRVDIIATDVRFMRFVTTESITTFPPYSIVAVLAVTLQYVADDLNIAIRNSTIQYTKMRAIAFLVLVHVTGAPSLGGAPLGGAAPQGNISNVFVSVQYSNAVVQPSPQSAVTGSAGVVNVVAASCTVLLTNIDTVVVNSTYTSSLSFSPLQTFAVFRIQSDQGTVTAVGLRIAVHHSNLALIADASSLLMLTASNTVNVSGVTVAVSSSVIDLVGRTVMIVESRSKGGAAWLSDIHLSIVDASNVTMTASIIAVWLLLASDQAPASASNVQLIVGESAVQFRSNEAQGGIRNSFCVWVQSYSSIPSSTAVLKHSQIVVRNLLVPMTFLYDGAVVNIDCTGGGAAASNVSLLVTNSSLISATAAPLNLRMYLVRMFGGGELGVAASALQFNVWQCTLIWNASYSALLHLKANPGSVVTSDLVVRVQRCYLQWYTLTSSLVWILGEVAMLSSITSGNAQLSIFDSNITLLRPGPPGAVLIALEAKSFNTAANIDVIFNDCRLLVASGSTLLMLTAAGAGMGVTATHLTLVSRNSIIETGVDFVRIYTDAAGPSSLSNILIHLEFQVPTLVRWDSNSTALRCLVGSSPVSLAQTKIVMTNVVLLVFPNEAAASSFSSLALIRAIPTSSASTPALSFLGDNVTVAWNHVKVIAVGPAQQFPNAQLLPVRLSSGAENDVPVLSAECVSLTWLPQPDADELISLINTTDSVFSPAVNTFVTARALRRRRRSLGPFDFIGVVVKNVHCPMINVSNSFTQTVAVTGTRQTFTATQGTPTIVAIRGDGARGRGTGGLKYSMPSAVIAIAGVTVSAGSAVGLPMMQFVAQRAIVRQLCAATSDEGAPTLMSDYIDNLFQIHIDALGSGAAYVAGSIVGNIVMFLTIFMLKAAGMSLQKVLVGWWRGDGLLWPDVWTCLASRVGELLPGSLWEPYTTVAQSIVAGAVTLMFISEAAGSWLLAVPSLALCIGFIVWLALRLCRSDFALLAVPCLSDRTDTIDALERALAFVGLPATHARAIKAFFSPRWRWVSMDVSDKGLNRHVERYGEVVALYSSRRHWFFLVEAMTAIGSGVVNGLSMGLTSFGGCSVQWVFTSILLLVCVVYAAFVVIMHPFNATADTCVVLAASLCSIVSLLLMLLPDPHGELQTAISTLLIIQSLLCAAAVPWAIIRSFLRMFRQEPTSTVVISRSEEPCVGGETSRSANEHGNSCSKTAASSSPGGKDFRSSQLRALHRLVVLACEGGRAARELHRPNALAATGRRAWSDEEPPFVNACQTYPIIK